MPIIHNLLQSLSILQGTVWEPVIVMMFGLIFGSYVTCMSYRLPRKLPTIWQHSYCPACKKTLGISELVPVFSWLFRLGRCGCKKSRIPLRYPLIEVGVAALFWLTWFVYGAGVSQVLISLLIVELTILSVAELETGIIPPRPVILIALWIFLLFVRESWVFAIIASGASAVLYFALKPFTRHPKYITQTVSLALYISVMLSSGTFR